MTKDKIISSVIVFLTLCLSGSIFFSDNTEAHEQIIHQLLATKSIRLFISNYPNSPIAQDLNNIDYMAQIVTGSEQEDEGANPLNHFFTVYNSDNDYLPWWGVVPGMKNARKWGMPLWNTAITEYKRGNKHIAYWYLGRALHILQDMTSPPHVNNDGHMVGDNFEKWEKANYSGNNIPDGSAIKSIKDYGSTVQDMAQITGNFVLISGKLLKDPVHIATGDIKPMFPFIEYRGLNEWYIPGIGSYYKYNHYISSWWEIPGGIYIENSENAIPLSYPDGSGSWVANDSGKNLAAIWIEDYRLQEMAVEYGAGLFLLLDNLTRTGGTEPRSPTDVTIDSFGANTDQIIKGSAATLFWEVSNTDSLSIEPDIGDVSLFGIGRGSLSVWPTETTTYTLTAGNYMGGSDTKSTTVRVSDPGSGPPPNPDYSKITDCPYIDSFCITSAPIMYNIVTINWDEYDTSYDDFYYYKVFKDGVDITTSSGYTSFNSYTVYNLGEGIYRFKIEVGNLDEWGNWVAIKKTANEAIVNIGSSRPPASGKEFTIAITSLADNEVLPESTTSIRVQGEMPDYNATIGKHCHKVWKGWPLPTYGFEFYGWNLEGWVNGWGNGARVIPTSGASWYADVPLNLGWNVITVDADIHAYMHPRGSSNDRGDCNSPGRLEASHSVSVYVPIKYLETPPPDPPTNVTATPVSATKVDVNWVDGSDKVADATINTVSGDFGIQSLSVSAAAPQELPYATDQDVIYITTVLERLIASCYMVYNPFLTLSGNTISINAEVVHIDDMFSIPENPPLYCVPIAGNLSFTKTVGPLPQGRYTIILNVDDAEYSVNNLSMDFEVVDYGFKVWSRKGTDNPYQPIAAMRAGSASNYNYGHNLAAQDITPPEIIVKDYPRGCIVASLVGSDASSPAAFSFYATDNSDSLEDTYYYKVTAYAGKKESVDSNVISAAVTNDISFSYRLDRDVWTSWTSSSGMSFDNLPDGPHTFEARVRDRAGNIGAAFSYPLFRTKVYIM